jgi:hypothetical protein
MIASTVLLKTFLLAASLSDLLVVQFPSKGKTALSLGMKAKAEVERTGTVTRVLIQLDDVRPPQSFLAGMNTYVAWAVSPEGSVDNLGELGISKTKGLLLATTQFDRFAILITAEPHYMVDKPSAAILYKNEASRSVANVPLKLEVGAYDYVGLPKAAGAVPSLVMEARAAVAIASAALAESRAEYEFRQAKVSLDTMEELFMRASPPDVVAGSAHETIRRAQRAVTAARQIVR